MFARATWYASGLGFFAKRPPPWIAIVVSAFSRERLFRSECLHTPEKPNVTSVALVQGFYMVESSVSSLLMLVSCCFVRSCKVYRRRSGAERSRAARPPAACEPRTRRASRARRAEPRASVPCWHRREPPGLATPTAPDEYELYT